MNALLLCQIWSVALNLKKDSIASDRTKLIEYIIVALKQSELKEIEIELAAAYINSNLALIDELISFS